MEGPVGFEPTIAMGCRVTGCLLEPFAYDPKMVGMAGFEPAVAPKSARFTVW